MDLKFGAVMRPRGTTQGTHGLTLIYGARRR
jgi:hypothetical protein